jgi:CelD/BcsL family acetyltransferase involved in cellulose biosynthesis
MSVVAPRIVVDVATAVDLDALSAEWRSLERRARSPSIFQSWTWVGCLFDERFDAPVLLRAFAGPELVGLALFNRRGGRLSLTESGDEVRDAPFIEHNVPLVAEGWEHVAIPAILQAAWEVPGVRRLVLGGVPAFVAESAGGIPLRMRERAAPYVDLERIREAGGDYLGSLTANARYQIKRSMRRFEAAGPLNTHAADTPDKVAQVLEELMRLHGETWQRRGKPGAFAHPFMQRFHVALVQRCLNDERLDLLTVRAGDQLIGHLYGFRIGGHVYAYQSGLASAPDASPHAKPGLTCHALAIARSLSLGDRCYDFLAGDDRYKRSLANAETNLFWSEQVWPRGPIGLVLRAWRMLTRRIDARKPSREQTGT